MAGLRFQRRKRIRRGSVNVGKRGGDSRKQARAARSESVGGGRDSASAVAVPISARSSRGQAEEPGHRPSRVAGLAGLGVGCGFDVSCP
jgi:hypothetical protein